MAWTPPALFVANTVLTAAQLNAQVVNNILETAAATAAAAGDLIYADAANSMGSRLAIGAAGLQLTSSGTVPQWEDRNPRNAIGASTTGSFSSTGTQKATATFTIPDAWSTGYTVLTWGVVRLVWDGTATTADIQPYVAGTAIALTEQDIVSTAVVAPVSVVGTRNGETATGVITVGLVVKGNGSGSYKDAVIQALALKT